MGPRVTVHHTTTERTSNMLETLARLTRRASLEREAAAIQREAQARVDLKMERARAARLEETLSDLLRGIDTAPLTRYLPGDEVRKELASSRTDELAVLSTHITWTPLTLAMSRARAELDRG